MNILQLNQIFVRKYFIFVAAGLFIFLIFLSFLLASGQSPQKNQTTNNPPANRKGTNPQYPKTTYVPVLYNQASVESMASEFVQDLLSYNATDTNGYMEEAHLATFTNSDVIDKARAASISQYGTTYSLSEAIRSTSVQYAYNNSIVVSVNADLVIIRVSNNQSKSYEVVYNVTFTKVGNAWKVSAYVPVLTH